MLFNSYEDFCSFYKAPLKQDEVTFSFSDVTVCRLLQNCVGFPFISLTFIQNIVPFNNPLQLMLHFLQLETIIMYKKISDSGRNMHR